MDNLQQAVKLAPESTRGLAALGYVSALSGQRDQAKEILDTLLKKSSQQFISSYSLALIHSALGEQREALDRLGGALEQRDPSLIFAKVDPRFDNIRDTSQFRDVVTELGLIA
jgi:tetratricopeptide (TPR) repeat protein